MYMKKLLKHHNPEKQELTIFYEDDEGKIISATLNNAEDFKGTISRVTYPPASLGRRNLT
jgi:hypothetical protein